MKHSITIRFDSEIMIELEKRAKKNYFSVPELAEDIVRRSMISYKGGKGKSRFNVDDKLVGIFSREKRGRKKKKTKKKTVKKKK